MSPIVSKRTFLLWLVPLFVLLFSFKGFSVENSFGADPLIKLYQLYSFTQNDSASETYVYPAESIDGKWNFFPLMSQQGEKTVYFIPEKRIGPFPIFFTFISSFFYKIAGLSGLIAIPVLTYILIAAFLIHDWKLHPISIITALAGTPAILYALEFSEVLPVVLLTIPAFRVFFRSQRPALWSLFLSGFLLGMSSWLRLEAFLLFFAFFLSILITNARTYWNEIYHRYIQSIRPFVILLSGTALAVLILLGFNEWNYGHIFGPRYLVNYSNGSEVSFVYKLKQMFVLLIGGYYKLGFFGYTPLFLVSIILFFTRASLRKSLDQLHYVSLGTLLIFLPSTSYLAFETGGFDWGPRFLAPALFPAILLLDGILKTSLDELHRKTVNPDLDQPITEQQARHQSSFIKIAGVYGGILILLLFSTGMTAVGVKMIRGYQKGQEIQRTFYEHVKADIRLFSDDFFIINSGSSLMKTPTLYARSPEKLNELIPLLKQNAPGKRIVYLDPGQSMKTSSAEYSFPESIRPLEDFLKWITPIPVLKHRPDEERRDYLKILEAKLKKERSIQAGLFSLNVYSIPEMR